MAVTPGTYEVSVWDTWKGEVLNTAETGSVDAGGAVVIELPDFKRDLAVALTRTSEPPAPEPDASEDGEAEHAVDVEIRQETDGSAAPVDEESKRPSARTNDGCHSLEVAPAMPVVLFVLFVLVTAACRWRSGCLPRSHPDTLPAVTRPRSGT